MSDALLSAIQQNYRRRVRLIVYSFAEMEEGGSFSMHESCYCGKGFNACTCGYKENVNVMNFWYDEAKRLYGDLHRCVHGY